jgi:hypothetical protein
MRTSGPATLEVEMPSGYEFVQSDANELVIQNNYTFIRDVFIGHGKIIWMFDRVTTFKPPFFLYNILLNNSPHIGERGASLHQISCPSLVPSRQFDIVPFGHHLRVTHAR